MKNENTLYDNDKTQYDEQSANVNAAAAAAQDADQTELSQPEAAQEPEAQQEAQEQPGEERAAAKQDASWGKAAAGMAAGVLLGSVGAYFATHSAMAQTQAETPEDPEDLIQEQSEHPAWTDGQVPVATHVNDGMSFSEAFAAARAEVGAGGAFEWRGHVYGTFYADEWNSMSADEREAYNNHFSWSNHSGSSSSANTAHAEPDVEVITVSETEVQVAQEQLEQDTAEEPVVTVAESGDAEVEILGVVHDPETGANIGGMVVDGQAVVLIDVDNSGEFDYAAVDANGDGQISADEIVEITDQHISVEHFESMSTGEDPLYAANDMTPDYVNDAPDSYDIA